ncbi:glycosyl transferase [Synergistales bacterium]|nr:glycosyl transferase [Synergistales bacterium]
MFGVILWHIAGALFILAVGSAVSWRTLYFWRPGWGLVPGFYDGLLFMAATIAAYVGGALCAWRALKLPRCGRMAGVVLSASLCYSISMLFLFLLRAYYSRSFLLLSYAFSVAWIYMGLWIFFSYNKLRYGFVPGYGMSELDAEWRDNFIKIPSPDSGERFDVLVVSPYQGARLSEEWTRYITNMMIQGVPMTHPGSVYEFFTGRLPIEYMSEGPGVVLRPSRAYLYVKRVLDWLLLLICFAPAVVCVSVLSVVLWCSSGSPVFFIQERIGKNGVPFKMYKFRSMTETGEVTGVGRFLRKYRLDELPQILNVAKGEMSFIGPRPEVPELTRKYTEKIAFYPYRYSMPPGITGWAQVNYGYASATSENKIKLGYDLYYIKHASFTLDMLILLKTARTMLSGAGSKGCAAL